MKLLRSPHAVHEIGLHYVWCTKYRHQILVEQVEIDLKQLIAEICIDRNWILHALEIMPDHVHAFIQTDHLTAPVEVTRTIKSITAVGIFTKFPKLKFRKFWSSGMWSRGAYYGSVGHVTEETVRRYILQQKLRD